jgi:hypothetical protein
MSIWFPRATIGPHYLQNLYSPDPSFHSSFIAFLGQNPVIVGRQNTLDGATT